MLANESAGPPEELRAESMESSEGRRKETKTKDVFSETNDDEKKWKKGKNRHKRRVRKERTDKKMCSGMNKRILKGVFVE